MQDQNTSQGFLAQDTIVLETSPIDSPVSIDSIIVSPVLEGGNFPSIDLQPFIQEHDGDEYEISIVNSGELSAQLNNGRLEVSIPHSEWFGTTSIQIKAQDLSTSQKLSSVQDITPSAFFDEAWVVYTSGNPLSIASADQYWGHLCCGLILLGS